MVIWMLAGAAFAQDTDNDGVPDRREDVNGDGILGNDDSDGDGIPDYRDADDDNDLLLTRDELQLGTDYLNPDTDGGGALDGEEVVDGRNPLDPFDDFPRMLVVSPPSPGVAGAVNVWTVTGAYPGQWIAVVGATQQGQAAIPGCPMTMLDLQSPQLVSFGQANASGVLTLGIQVPAGLSGVGVWFQAASPTACEVSAPVHATFQ
ncbi:MAG: hypothetical protein H6738_00175 [Alphaproteobacteria bacterium]|nr:hypothetical protein [Alphaproteobacteria bacterium]MCB9695182.1 hypothetical protein [Alphaproteobacteria bacterium]